MMNKFFNYAFIGAIALTGATMFAGCSSTDDATAEDTSNPNYNPQAKEVTTQFVLNVATNTGENVTRQTDAIVQKRNNFRGMQDAKLIGLSTGKASTFLAPYNGEATSGFDVNKTYELGTLYGKTAVSNQGDDNRDNSSRRVLELTLPLNTDAMLVYARAIPEGTVKENGKVAVNIASNVENTTFTLQPRINDKGDEYAQTYKLAALILNRILLSEIPVQASDYAHNGVEQVGELPAISWRGLAKSLKDGVALAPLQENLATVYNNIVTINTAKKEVRAGSASAICSIAYNIYKAVESCKGATATNDAELNAQRLAVEIEGRLGNYFDGYSTSEAVTQFRSIGSADTQNTIINGLVNRSHVLTVEEYTTQFGLVGHGDLMGFPTSFGLPLGVAQLEFTDFNASGEGGFSYKAPNNVSLIDQNSHLAAKYYTYPSELLYFDNSLLRVNNNVVAVNDYPNGYSKWDAASSWDAYWNVGKVASTTRSVAVKNNINYGVSMLQSKVALDAESFTDNRQAITGEANQTLTAAQVRQLQVVGVLIGGQNNVTGWNYLPKGAETDSWNYVVYDNHVQYGTIPTTTGEEIYTLVFDNYKAGTQTDQQDVYVALELKNNGPDFYGQGNLIRNGGTFYLTGKLTLGDNRINNWDENYPVPPYTDGGASQQITRIFTQDFMTVVTFKIGATSLQKALITVPDLRSTQTSLGLSVDLQWRPGLEFTTTLGQ